MVINSVMFLSAIGSVGASTAGFETAVVAPWTAVGAPNTAQGTNKSDNNSFFIKSLLFKSDLNYRRLRVKTRGRICRSNTFSSLLDSG